MPTAAHRRLRSAEAEARHRLANADDIARRKRERITAYFREHWHLLPHPDRVDMFDQALLDAAPAVIRMQAQIQLSDIAAERATL